MKVTRDVIYDLLPGYFASDVSADTRAMVEEYFDTDPEFARMAKRFNALTAEKRQADDEATAAAREREAFVRVRTEAELPQKTRAAALIWGFASLFSFGIALMTWNARMGWRNPGVWLGLCFGAMAVVIFVLSYRVKPDSWWRPLAGLDDENLKSLGWRRRRSHNDV
jgi:anti-sigma factor RsiW